MHDKLLNTLQNVAEVRLVSRLKDQRLGFDNPGDLRIFIPDLHLISDQRLKEGNFRFYTNCEPLLVTLLGALTTLQRQKGEKESISVTHLGDILDLWRETGGVDPNEDVPARIANDHLELINALRNPDLGATVFLGNHDFELHLWASYAGCIRRIFIPESMPRGLVLHGDVFDWIERLPEQAKNLLVYFFSPQVEPQKYELGQMYDLVRRTAPAAENPEFIKCSTPVQLSMLQDPDGPDIPEYFNVQKKGEGPVHNFLDLAYDQAQQANTTHGLDLTAIIIGHTHHARIAVRDDGGRLFALIDCGAWIENCVDSAGNVMLNAQIAALCANEFRIYQLAQKPGTPVV